MKLSSVTFALFALTQISLLAAGVDLGSSAGFTPYDAYMRPVKRVLSSVGTQKASMERAEQLMIEGRGFRYVHSDPYNPSLPAETAARRAGDCKDKALWLCDQLRDPSARFVIGKMKRSATISHAWVMWENQGRWWVLDCTLNSRPLPMDRVARNDYVPLYSYAKNGTYRHSATALMVADAGTRPSDPVAATGGRP
ncbi:MAG: Transglutaminase-like superfamily [Chthoniobacter sp.]|jgi:hypothetical protein|nr:Transglutaminase-like superfamily [Chthoniobacter sp.]